MHQAERFLNCRGHKLTLGSRTLIMGILNATPDSFSDGGNFLLKDQAVRHALHMQQQGADIIDIGGESTRPGAIPVTEQEELERVIPIVEAIRQEVDIPISVDTYKAQVAEAALKAGAHMINDVWGGQKDPSIYSIVAEYEVPYVIMHNRTNKNYVDLITDIKSDLTSCVSAAIEAGVKPEQIIIDPGIGFAKNYDHNVATMQSLDSISSLGFPVLLGTSRKSFIGLTLDLPVEQRLEGTLATLCLGITKGVDIVRVHDVQPAARCCKMMDKLVR